MRKLWELSFKKEFMGDPILILVELVEGVETLMGKLLTSVKFKKKKNVKLED